MRTKKRRELKPINIKKGTERRRGKKKERQNERIEKAH